MYGNFLYLKHPLSSTCQSLLNKTSMEAYKEKTHKITKSNHHLTLRVHHQTTSLSATSTDLKNPWGWQLHLWAACSNACSSCEGILADTQLKLPRCQSRRHAEPVMLSTLPVLLTIFFPVKSLVQTLPPSINNTVQQWHQGGSTSAGNSGHHNLGKLVEKGSQCSLVQHGHTLTVHLGLAQGFSGHRLPSAQWLSLALPKSCSPITS